MMPEKFVGKLNEIIAPLMENPYIYISFFMIVYFLGGVDETLITLVFLNLTDFVLGLFSNKRKREHVLTTKLKMYLVIALGVAVDRLLGLSDIKLRAYIILLYSYNELESILDFLKEDENLLIPKKLKNALKKLRNKG